MKIHDTANFFIILAPNLEKYGLRELETKFQAYFPNEKLVVMQLTLGGIEIECPLWCGFLLNKILRTPTRILLRLYEFKCRDAPKLFHKISRFQWSPWLLGQKPSVNSSSKNSRLFDSRKIESAVIDGITEYYRRQPIKKKYLTAAESLPEESTCIFVRIEDDNCQISLDTTGERLHLRGEKTFKGHAPIRESLASLLLMALKEKFQKEITTLIDPMCGTGTFLYEAKNFFQITTSRHFGYELTPLFIENTNFFQIDEIPLPPLFTKMIGSDIDPDIVKKTSVLLKEISITQADLLARDVNKQDNSCVVINPPYGIRVGEGISQKYYYEILESIIFKYSPGYIGIIIPAEYVVESNEHFTIRDRIRFSNGGIEVFFLIIQTR